MGHYAVSLSYLNIWSSQWQKRIALVELVTSDKIVRTTNISALFLLFISIFILLFLWRILDSFDALQFLLYSLLATEKGQVGGKIKMKMTVLIHHQIAKMIM